MVKFGDLKEDIRMKGIKALSLALSLALLLGVTACSPKESTSSSGAGQSASNSTAGASSAEQSGDPADGVKQPEGYPSKAINWIIPVAAGAAVDLPTRALIDVLDLGEPVVAENIAGANQTLGTAEAAARDADGYTLLTMANACGITQPIMGGLAYTLDDFRFIAMLAPSVQATICVKADSKLQNAQDFVDYVQNNEYTFGVPNAGGYGHIAIATTLDQLGAYDNGTMMVYSGSNENITAILNGEVEFAIVDDTDAISRVESGELRVLAILHDEQSRLFPDADLISDYGVEDISTFIGLKWIAIRADTPTEIVDWLKQELNAAIQSEEYQQYLETMGFGPVREYTEEELDELIATAAEDYKVVMEKVGLI